MAIRPHKPLVDQFVAREVNGQKIVRCQDRKLGGYPVRLALDCSSYAVVDPASGWQVSGGPLQVYWQIHEPGQASIKTHAPMHIEQPAFGQSYDITGSLIQSSVLLTPPNGIRAVSFKAEEATLAANNAVLGQPVGTIKADSLEFNASPRQQTTGDLDLNFKASELSIDRIPVLNGEMTFTAKDGLNALMQDRRDPAGLWLRQSGKIENIDGWLEIGQKTLKLKGGHRFQSGRPCQWHPQAAHPQPQPRDRQGEVNPLSRARRLQRPAHRPSVDGKTGAGWRSGRL